MMVARTPPEPTRLILTFERDGAEMIHTRAANEDKAIVQAVTLLLAAKPLRPGDRLTITAAE